MGEEENGYWRTVGREQREGLVPIESEVTRGRPVENSCWNWRNVNKSGHEKFWLLDLDF